ncbi:hypothetical protein QTP88_011445 [Uroleucon formosanum]
MDYNAFEDEFERYASRRWTGKVSCYIFQQEQNPSKLAASVPMKDYVMDAFYTSVCVDLKYDFNVSETNRFYCLTSSSQSVYPYNGGYFSTALSSPFISPLSIDRIPMV